MKNQYLLLLMSSILFFSSCNAQKGKTKQVFIKKIVDEMPKFIGPTYFGKQYVDKVNVQDCQFCYEKNLEENTIEYSYKIDGSPGINKIKYSYLVSGDSTFIILRVWNIYYKEINTYMQAVNVYKKTGDKWSDISKVVLPKNYKEYFSNTEAAVIDSIIILSDKNNKLEAKLIWKNGMFQFGQPLAENFGKMHDPWDDIITPEIKKEFKDAWAKLVEVIKNDDKTALVEIIGYPLIIDEYFNYSKKSSTSIQKEDIGSKFELLFSLKKDIDKVWLKPYRYYFSEPDYNLHKKHIAFYARFDINQESSISLFLIKLEDKIYLKIIQISTYDE